MEHKTTILLLVCSLLIVGYFTLGCDINSGELLTFGSDAIEYEPNDTVSIAWSFVNPNLVETKFKTVITVGDLSETQEFTLDSYGDEYSKTTEFNLTNFSVGTYECTITSYEYSSGTYSRLKIIDIGDIAVVESKGVTSYEFPELTITSNVAAIDISTKYKTYMDTATPAVISIPPYELYKINVVAEGYLPYTFETTLGNESDSVDVQLTPFVATENATTHTMVFTLMNQNEDAIYNAFVYAQGQKITTNTCEYTAVVEEGNVAVVIMKDGYQPYVHTYSVTDDKECDVVLNEIGERYVPETISTATTTEDTVSEDEETTNEPATNTTSVSDVEVVVDSTNDERNRNILIAIVIIVIGYSLYKKRK